MKLRLAKRAGIERCYRIHKVWVIVEYRPYVRRRPVICLGKVWRKKLAVVRPFAGMIFRVLFRMLAAAGLTYLYAAWDIRQAYIQRGYKAYGGEYLIIPFVFYVVFKAIVFAEWLVHIVKQRIGRKEEKACVRRIPEAARPRE